MEPFTTLRSRVVPLVRDDIDTDQIIPARFLKVTDKQGLGDKLFADWRANADFVLNQPEYAGCQVLVAGNNFGCGSSREHAPWALMDWGLRAIIAISFADIFRNNALKNGLLPVAVPAPVQASLLEQLGEDAGVEVTIELEPQTLTLPDGTKVEFEVDPFAKKCLLAGSDQLGYLLGFRDAIERYEQDTNR